jgi:molybdopterin-guanine dinucleotide biosynthesis protein A
MTPIATVILAGGRSSRMGGGDKSLLELAGRCILAILIERLGSGVEPLAINANGDPARFQRFNLPILADGRQTFDGPLAGILAAMYWADDQGHDSVLTVAGDTPFFPLNLVSQLAAASSPSTISVASSRGRLHPAFAIWPVALRADLENQLTGGLRRVTSFIDRHPCVEIDFPDARLDDETFDPFFNVNTPGDLVEARRIANKLDR